MLSLLRRYLDRIAARRLSKRAHLSDRERVFAKAREMRASMPNQKWKHTL